MLRNIERNLTDCFLQKTQQTTTHFLKTRVSKKSQLQNQFRKITLVQI